MSVRRSLAAVPAELRFLLTGAAAAGLLASCGMPQPVEPPPPPMAEMEAPPELYGAPSEEMDPAAQAEAYAQADTSGAAGNPYADQPPSGQPAVVEDERRPGWGTMEPIPNPPGTAPSRRDRAYAQAEPVPEAPYAPREPALPEAQERLGAYGTAPVAPPAAPPSVYARRTPPPPPPVYEAPETAPYAQGVPAASYPPVVVTMQPVPNPTETASARSVDRAQTEPRVRHSVAPAVQSRRAARAAADERLMGGPARAERPAARRTTVAEGSARNAAAAVSTRPRSTESRPANRPAAASSRQAAAKLPAANTPAGRAARLKRIQGTLAQLVQRDSTLSVPERVQPGTTERITLTLPQSLSEALTREAGTAGLRELASKAVVGATLAGDGWRIEPEEPQTDELRSGRVSSFTWSATPERGAGPLTANVDTRLSGGGRFETLQLGAVTREIEGTGAQGVAGDGVGGFGWRTVGAALLLLALLIGGLFYARRSDNGVGDGSRRRFNRRRPDPVNLTPYSPSADTDAPVGGRGDPDPEPSRP